MQSGGRCSKKQVLMLVLLDSEYLIVVRESQADVQLFESAMAIPRQLDGRMFRTCQARSNHPS